MKRALIALAVAVSLAGSAGCSGSGGGATVLPSQPPVEFDLELSDELVQLAEDDQTGRPTTWSARRARTPRG